MSSSQELVNFIWSIADVLRGDYKRSEYGKVILPLVVLRRLDCLLTATKSAVLAKNEMLTGHIANVGPILERTAGHSFYNVSPLDFPHLIDDVDHLAENIRSYIAGFSPGVTNILEQFRFNEQITRLDEAGLLYPVVGKLAEIDLHPKTVESHQMGFVFEKLVRRFSEASDEIAGEHFTPRELIRLMVNFLLITDNAELATRGIVRTVYDPACGTGGMLSAAEDHVRRLNSHAKIIAYGQELNSETYAICRSNMMLKDQDPERIKLGNSFSHDQYADSQGNHGFDYMLANPPFGVEWKKVEAEVREEAMTKGFNGRFGAGLPRINDGSFLFLQHMLAKMRPANQGGSRIAILFNGSPMFIGGAGSGESEIRRWILENDWLEAVIALPDQLLYNTSIATYCWILSNRKIAGLKDRVLLLDGREYWSKMRESFGDKHKIIDDGNIADLTEIYRNSLDIAANVDHPHHALVKVFATHTFGFQRIIIDRPLRLRFGITQESLTTIREARPLAIQGFGSRLATTLKPLVGLEWQTKREAFDTLRHTAIASGLQWPSGKSALRAIRSSISVVDPNGELQTIDDEAEPDLDLRYYEDVPLTSMQSPPEQLRAQVDLHMRDHVLPNSPDAWVDHSKTKIGFEIPRLLFSPAKWGEPFEPLRKFARQVAMKPTTGSAKMQLPVIRASDLHSVNYASELSETAEDGELLAACSGGDLVGSASNWRLLPKGFGTALTPLNVIRPIGNTGRVLCEWLNSAKTNEYGLNRRVSLTIPVPAAAINDSELNQLLEDLYEGRRKLRQTTSRILPNIFDNSVDNYESIRRKARSTASEARLAGELARPLEDPVWRAEWSYPYHVAALARQYRIATTPEAKKETILKLGEGIARTLGILSLAILIRRRGSFTAALQQPFRNGATFGTWLKLVKEVSAEGAVPELPELERVMDSSGAHNALQRLLEFRNFSGHSHGVRSRYELKYQVDQLEPLLVSSVDTVGWLSGLTWNIVEQCQFTGNGYRVIGERLRGSHPDWEPVDQPSADPIIPNRIYVEGPSSNVSIDLSPVARVEFCEDNSCRAQELFLLDSINDQILALRSLRDHLIRREV